MNKLFPSGLFLSSPGMENFIPLCHLPFQAPCTAAVPVLSVISCPSWYLLGTVGQDESVGVFPLLFSILYLLMAGSPFLIAAEQRTDVHRIMES